MENHKKKKKKASYAQSLPSFPSVPASGLASLEWSTPAALAPPFLLVSMFIYYCTRYPSTLKP